MSDRTNAEVAAEGIRPVRVMEPDEIETVLANWIEQALSPIGRLPEGITPAAWIAARFAAWWRDRARDAIGDADRAASTVREELMRLVGWEAFGEALHEMIHLQDALCGA